MGVGDNCRGEKVKVNLYVGMHLHLVLLKGVSMGKGCIRFTKPEKMDYDVVRKMLKGTYTSNEAICD
jgi:hypothetical protein